MFLRILNFIPLSAVTVLLACEQGICLKAVVISLLVFTLFFFLSADCYLIVAMVTVLHHVFIMHTFILVTSFVW